MNDSNETPTRDWYHIVSDVTALCAENERLRSYVRELRVAEREQLASGNDSAPNIVDAYFLNAGKKAAVDKCIHSWNSDPKYDGETWQDFESWCKQHIDRDEVPDCMSVATFRETCRAQLMDVYNERLNEAKRSRDTD